MMSNKPTDDPLDFVKNMWGNMGFSLPGMVAPTFDVDELEKRIADLKAVEGWLRMNLSMLQMSIQGLEMQCTTLNAVRSMSQMASNAAENAQTGAEGSEALAQAAMWPWQMMQQMQTQMQQQAAAAEADAAAQAAPKRSRKAE